MQYSKRPAALGLVVTVLWLVVACGAPEPTATPPPPTPIPPTATSAMPPEPVTTETSLIHRSIPYVPGGNFQQNLTLYLPLEGEAGSAEVPVLVVAHGWSLGKEDLALSEVMRFVNQLGYAAVSIDYRDDSKTGSAWKAHQDGACALAWIYANAGEYGLDTDRMAAFGNSYGAMVLTNLALADDPGHFLAGCANDLPATRPFKGVIPFGAGAFGVPGEGLSMATQAEVLSLQTRLMFGFETLEEMNAIHEALAALHPTEWATSAELSPKAVAFAQLSPAYWVSADDPPLLLLYPEQDQFWPQSEYDAFAQLLGEVGVPYTYLVLPGAGHTNWNREDAEGWQEPIQEFLEGLFGG